MWRATLSDGRVVDGVAGWFDLEAQCEAEGVQITVCEVREGLQTIRCEAQGHRLVSGTAVHVLMDFAGGRRTCRQYHWVRREELHCWRWHITDGLHCWQVEAPPGDEMCPDPMQVVEPCTAP